MTSRIVPLLAAATCVAAVAVPTVAGAVPRAKAAQCGTTSTTNGGRALYITASGVGCTTAKAIARRANGRTTYKANGFTCHNLGSTYVCNKGKKPKPIIAFGYRKRS